MKTILTHILDSTELDLKNKRDLISNIFNCPFSSLLEGVQVLDGINCIFGKEDNFF